MPRGLGGGGGEFGEGKGGEELVSDGTSIEEEKLDISNGEEE